MISRLTLYPRFLLAWAIYWMATATYHMQAIVSDELDSTQRALGNVYEALIRTSVNVQGTGKGPWI